MSIKIRFQQSVVASVINYTKFSKTADVLYRFQAYRNIVALRLQQSDEREQCSLAEPKVMSDYCLLNYGTMRLHRKHSFDDIQVLFVLCHINSEVYSCMQRQIHEKTFYGVHTNKKVLSTICRV